MNGKEVSGLSQRGQRWEEGAWFAGFVWHPRWLSCGPSDGAATLRCPLSHLYSTWPQEVLSPPDTSLEGVGWRDPNTLRAGPGLSVLRPQNASAPVTQS